MNSTVCYVIASIFVLSGMVFYANYKLGYDEWVGKTIEEFENATGQIADKWHSPTLYLNPRTYYGLNLPNGRSVMFEAEKDRSGQFRITAASRDRITSK